MRRIWKWMGIGLLLLAVASASILLLAGREAPEDTAVTQETAEPAQALQTEAQTQPAEVQTQPTEAAQAVTYDAVPRYFQTDYPYIKFGNGTIATSGCSMTCLAMMATYLTDREYTPDQLAYHFGSYGKNNIERLEYGIEQMQLPVQRIDDCQAVLRALKEGKTAIIMVNSQSVFTQAQHFIVLAGMTEDGKILVNDPNQYTHSGDVYLEDGYAGGFRDYDILKGFSNGWVFDKAAMPQEPYLFDASKPEQQENRYDGYELPEEDIYVLACFAWAEAREQPEEVQQAVLEVVLNRLVSEDFPNTVHDVIYGTEFYRAVSKMQRVDEPDLAQYRAVTAAMYGPYVLPAEVLYYSPEPTKGEVWGQVGDYVFLYTK
ncbi:MAG: C39 family peptidase [Faecousia sp.]